MTVYPEDVNGYWNKGLKTVIFSGCAVLDINDYNGNYAGTPDHASSPGLRWAQKGPVTLLGYNYLAPHDNSGATAIVQEWLASSNGGAIDQIGAWASANEDHHAWNACALDSDALYWYFSVLSILGVPIDHNWRGVEVLGFFP